MGVVYKHIFPNGKVYIGQTKFLDYARRWSGGYGYMNQPVFNAIQKYGWENIKHEILYADNVECSELRREAEYIKQYKADDPKYGYNYPYTYQKSKRKKCKLLELNIVFDSLSSASEFVYGHRYSSSQISKSCINNTIVDDKYHFIFV